MAPSKTAHGGEAVVIAKTEADEEIFDVMAGHVRTVAGEMLREFFGERCPDFEKDCIGCQRWQHLDKLTDNPFTD